MPKNFDAYIGILSGADPGTEWTKITPVAKNAATRITCGLCIAKKVNIESRRRLQDFV
jgi:hypothetical protein